jgi:ABC-type uncharacterized transport system substrate-binding protein
MDWARILAYVTVGGIPFTRGSLAYLLRNRFYLGEVAFKGEVLQGEQILKGEKSADIPVQQSTKVELIINLKTLSQCVT